MTSVVRVILYRDNAGTAPWGFRLQGGNDVGGPLIIQRVFLGSPSEGELHRGDVIVRIGNHDSTRYSHHEAQMAIKNATNHLDLTVLRRGGGGQPPSPTPVPSAGYHASPLGHYLPKTDQRRFKPPPPQNNPQAQHGDIDLDKEIERELISHQPHRTLPLITPAIKVKHDLPTGSYLRHVHDPYAKGPRQEYAMKTRVHDSILNAGVAMSTGSSPARSATPEVIGQVGPNSHLVHRQYNSPINLYSAQNVADTIAGQTGVTPAHGQTLSEFLKGAILEFAAQAQSDSDRSSVLKRLPRPFDITKSPTYQTIYEKEWKDLRRAELREHRPVQNHVKFVASQPATIPHHTTSKDYDSWVNSFGIPKDRILQSRSFDLITTTLIAGETDF